MVRGKVRTLGRGLRNHPITSWAGEAAPERLPAYTQLVAPPAMTNTDSGFEGTTASDSTDVPTSVAANSELTYLARLINEGESLTTLSHLDWVAKVGEAALRDLEATEAQPKSRDEVLAEAKRSTIPFEVADGTFKMYLGRIASRLESPIVSKGRGKGGGFYISSVSTETATAVLEQATVDNAPEAIRARVEKEKLLYQILTEWLVSQGYRTKDISSVRALGKWGNPDVAGIQIHDHFGSIELEVATIEAKVSAMNWKQDIFEAISHRRYANRAYYAFAVPEDSARKESEEMRYYSQKFGIGVLTVVLSNEVYSRLTNGDLSEPVSPDDAEVKEVHSPLTDLVPIRYRREFCEAIGITRIEDLGSWGQGA